MCEHKWLELEKGKGKKQDWVRCLECGEWIAAYYFFGETYDSIRRKMNET